MDRLLIQLRACADPTRLRLLALCARGAFCVVELTEILAQSQPRLSRHLRLLVDAGLLDCSREGSRAWFSLSVDDTASAILARIDGADPLHAADARAAARVLAERARIASDGFARRGAAWDEMGALGLPSARVEQALLGLLPNRVGHILDLGTGTAGLLELLAPRATTALGIDASPAMLALARTRLARPDLSHCRVRQCDAYRLPLPDARFDLVLAQMVLHHAEDPAAILAEANRVLRPGGTLVVIDLDAAAGGSAQEGFRWPGFANETMRDWLRAAGLTPRAGIAISGALTIRLWPARRAHAMQPTAQMDTAA